MEMIELVEDGHAHKIPLQHIVRPLNIILFTFYNFSIPN